MKFIDGAEFYYKTKYEVQEKIAEDEVKIANNFKDIATNFALKHPKAVESAITGGILGAGSELVMPSRQDPLTGQGSTNLGEIAKRGLLGATLGGLGGEIKTQVRSHMPKMAEEDFKKIAGLYNKITGAMERNPVLTGAGIGGLSFGVPAALAPNFAVDKEGKAVAVDTSLKDRLVSGLGMGLAGAGIGALGGHTYKKINELGSLMTDPYLSGGQIIKKDKITLPSDKGKVLNLPVGQKPKSNPISKGDKSPKGTVIPFPGPEKTAGLMDLVNKAKGVIGRTPTAQVIGHAATPIVNAAPGGIMNTAGRLMAQNPRVGGAILGAGAGAAGNFLSGSDNGVESTLAGAGLGALGGNALLRSSIKRTSPLMGANFANGARAEMRAVNNANRVTTRPGVYHPPAGTVSAQSLNSVPDLHSLVQSSGARNIGPQINPRASIGPAPMPVRPQEIDFSKRS